MRTIIPGNSKISSIISATVKSVESYKKSSFIVARECEEGHLICNTLTGELLLLTSEEEYILNNANNYQNLSDSNGFYQHGLLVSSDCDETKRTEQLRTILQKVDVISKKINHYNILPTTSCNARCFYCYESGVKHVTMTQEVAEQLISFICANRDETRPILISWFGGEPTLGKKWIDYICERLSSLQIPFHSEMVSNGYLFDAELVRKAKEHWRLQGVQITLDGTEHVYNKIKSL